MLKNMNEEEIKHLTNINWVIYKAGIESDDFPMSRQLILAFKKRILSCNKVEFITELFSCNFHSDYTLQFLFSLPELWIDFKLEDWIAVVSNTKRITPRPLGDQEGCFCDILLLCHYLGIDGFKILFLSNLDKDAKKNILSYFRMHPFLFNPSLENPHRFKNVAEDIFSILKNYKKAFLERHISINTFDKEDIQLKIKEMWELLK